MVVETRSSELSGIENRHLVNDEPKEAFKKRLREEGRWEAFIRAREKLKDDGMEAREAWRQAALLFQPQVLEVPEVAMTEMCEPSGLGKEAAALKEVERMQAAAKEEVERAEEESEERLWNRMAELVEGKRCNDVESLRWACENLHTPVRRIDRAGIPSAAALGWLRWARQSPVNESEFRKSVMVKLLPDRKSLDHEESMRDDGGAILDAIERVKSARDAASMETKG